MVDESHEVPQVKPKPSGSKFFKTMEICGSVRAEVLTSLHLKLRTKLKLYIISDCELIILLTLNYPSTYLTHKCTYT